MTAFKGTAATYQQGAQTLARQYYVSPDVLSDEVNRLFRPSWQCVGRADRLAEPGAYVLHEQFGDSAIVLRDKSGELRAFWNMCRHRGTRLCDVAQGRLSARRIR